MDTQMLFLKNHPFLKEPAQIVYRNQKFQAERGTLIADFLHKHYLPGDDNIFAVEMNHRIISTSSRIIRSGYITPVTYQSHHGEIIYRRHLIMMLYEVFYTNYPGAKIRIGQAMSEGIYFEIDGIRVDSKLVRKLEDGLHALNKEKRQFFAKRVPVEEARRLFVHEGSDFKKEVLEHWPSSTLTIMTLGSFVDFALGPVAPHTGFFDNFRLLTYEGDLILQFPNPEMDDAPRNEEIQPKLYRTHKESRRWSELLGVRHVGQLNAVCINGSIREIVQIAEGLHEKKMSEIADQIEKTHKRLVFIAGPSSSGKTTFSKRLSIQLRVAGLAPVTISLDNYYKDRKDIPRDAKGGYDFETLEALDINFLNQQILELLAGKKVDIPKYNFATGKRDASKVAQSIQLKNDSILIIEGIHGLNDALTPSVPCHEKFRIYINALNPLAIDEHNRIQTSEIRLIRRIVRDRHYRGYLAAETIAGWPSVRLGERKYIFPFQESADVIFDSSLIYEFSALKIFAERYLLEVPRSHPSFAEAYRLLKFLSMFVAMLPGDIPQTSLLREFIGGSGFSY